MNTEEKCYHYGRFMSGLERSQTEALYWSFFGIVICMLFACSWNYGRMMEKIEHLKTENERRQRLLRRGFTISFAGGLIGCVFGVLAAFTLLTLQFCDEEPLASLYWSTWTVLVVGGIVAIFGISLHIRHLINSSKLPPWALALGTPVLVVAGLGHYFQGKLSRKAQRIVEKGREIRSRHRNDSSDGNLEAGLGRGSSDLSDSDTTSPSTSAGRPAPPAHGDFPYLKTPAEWYAQIVDVTESGDIVIRIAPELKRQIFAKSNPLSCTTLAGMDPSTSKLEVGNADHTAKPRANTVTTIESVEPRRSSL